MENENPMTPDTTPAEEPQTLPLEPSEPAETAPASTATPETVPPEDTSSAAVEEQPPAAAAAPDITHRLAAEFITMQQEVPGLHAPEDLAAEIWDSAAWKKYNDETDTEDIAALMDSLGV